MATYIALLRGINVSGQRKIKMDELKILFESLYFKNVRTYIQSGNVVFEDGETDSGLLGKIIEDKILKDLGLEVYVIIRNQVQLKAILRDNPFMTSGNSEISALYVTFLSDYPNDTFLDRIKEVCYTPDEFSFIGREVYLFCPNGYGRTKLNNSFFENKLKLKATTRNWKTINELNEMVDLN